ncbi:MFS transporter [Leifsonia sp. Root112D2]|uniref:MFS transporter n=1 Tax=Leifsonia sp. Root112D2 TaxID=1736426 RepID=UPI00138EE4DA|nr:MFS transporter [Leifsonia sp. Root112D2]
MTTLQRRVLLVAILASFVAFLDGSVINVALPAISRELGGGLPLQQWVVDAYLVTLGALILVAGSLSDVFGRQRVLRVGLVWFGLASLLCAVAPTGVFLVAARALQGVAGALLVPSSLAIIISSFSGAAQAKAIGQWTAWTGVAFVAGPLVGGVFVDTLSWRYVFAINVVPIVATLWLMRGLRGQDVRTGGRIDYLGAILGAVGLGGAVFALIEQGQYGWAAPRVWIPLVIGLASLVAFVIVENRSAAPMLPFVIFRVHNFWVGNVATFLVYGALAFGPLIVTLYLQQVAGYPATAAGLALIPPTLVMLLLSSYFGGLAGRHGPRLFMALGPVVAACGFLTMMLMGRENVVYWTELLPGVLLFGLGLSMTVAPLTSAILGSISAAQAGIGSATNNAISRVAGLITVACAGVIVGEHLDHDGLVRALIATAALMVIGGLVSAIGIRNPRHE